MTESSISVMSKKGLIICLFFITGQFFSFGQTKTDSLLQIWEDESQTFDQRFDAAKSIIYPDLMYSIPDSAERFAAELLRLSLGIGDSVRIAESYQFYGIALSIQGKYGDAIDKLTSGRAIMEKLPNRNGLSSALIEIGFVYDMLGEYEQALDYYQSALAIDLEIRDSSGMGSAYNNIGLMHREMGDLEKALEYYEKAYLTSFFDDDFQLQSYALLNMGETENELGNFNDADSLIQLSLRLAEGLNDKIHSAIAYKILGTLSFERDQFNQSKNYCLKSYRFALEAELLKERKEACECLYEAYKALEQYEKSVGYLEESVRISDQLAVEEAKQKLQVLEFRQEALADSLKREEERLKLEFAHQQEISQKNRSRNIAIASGIIVLILALGLLSRYTYIRKSKAILEEEKDRSENLLLNILPSEIAEELKEKGEAKARRYNEVSILFTDFQDFTKAGEKFSPEELVEEINTCFKAFDEIVSKYGIEKIKTIGDAYMAAGGLPKQGNETVLNTVLAGLEMQVFMKKRKSDNPSAFNMRLGIHTGTVVAGIVGNKKFQYDIWGDSVNTASRMESNGSIGKVNISQSTYDLVKNHDSLSFEPRGKIKVKGKREMDMYFVENN